MLELIELANIKEIKWENQRSEPVQDVQALGEVI